MTHLVRKLSWKWDKPSCVLWAAVEFADGQAYSIGIPLAQVVSVFDSSAAQIGLQLPAYVGDVESVDGFFSGIKKLAKSATKAVKSTVKVATKQLGNVAKAAAVVVRSKYTTAALGALAVAFPAVGGPALLAQQAAARVAAMASQANDARRMISSGMRTVGLGQVVNRANALSRNVQRLAATNTPAARMAVAALKGARV